MKKNAVEIREFAMKQVVVPIVGISPLITHKFSEKARRMIEEKQAGIAKSRKHDVRNPEEEYELAKYKSTMGWDGFPAGGIKKCAIRGAKMIGMVMKDANASFFIKADDMETNLIKIHEEAKMRTDMVRIGMGVADVRYRPQYTYWKANLTIEYNEGMISLSQLLQIIKAGGWGNGIGEWRPEKSGEFGRFTLANEIQEEN